MRRLPPKKTRAISAASTLLFAGVLSCSPALSADGSANNNPDLLRGSLGAGCTNNFFCSAESEMVAVQPSIPVAQPSHKIVAPNAQPAPVSCGGVGEMLCSSAPRQPQLIAPQLQAAPTSAPPYQYQEPFEADWSLSLLGTYETGSVGSRFGVSIAPEMSLSRTFSAGTMTFGAGAALEKEGGDAFRLSGANADGSVEFNLGSDTRLTAGGNLNFEQASPYGLDSAVGVASEPQIITGGLTAGAARRFGRLGVEINGTFERQAYGDTALIGGGMQDNSYRNRLGFGGSARALYELRGPLSAFVEGSANRDLYDTASVGAGAVLNSWTYAIRGGVTGNWGDVFIAEASVGYGLRSFDSALLSDVPSALINANFTYRPDGSLELTAAFGTNFAVPDSIVAATTEVSYDGSLGMRYPVNDWLALRASISGGWSRLSDGSSETRRYGLGAGTDYQVNRNTAFTADYAYSGRESTSSGYTSAHRVAVGVKLSR